MAEAVIGNFGAGRYGPANYALHPGGATGRTALDLAARIIEEQGERALNRVMIRWAILWGFIVLLAAVVSGGYLLKSWMGIDLFVGHSALHDVFFAKEYVPHP